MAICSPGPDPTVKGAAIIDSRTPGARHDSLEDTYAGIDYLVDVDKGYSTGTVVEEDDPLAEFEAWLASGAVEIVDKL